MNTQPSETTDIRVRIAQDTLKQIAAHKIEIGRGYLSLVDATYPKWDKQLSLAILEPDAFCECCALGALFVGLVIQENNCTVGDTIVRSFAEYGEPRLAAIFGDEQVKLIEHSFEGWKIDGDESEELSIYPNDVERLVAIMKNIVKNAGVFKP